MGSLRVIDLDQSTPRLALNPRLSGQHDSSSSLRNMLVTVQNKLPKKRDTLKVIRNNWGSLHFLTIKAITVCAWNNFLRQWPANPEFASESARICRRAVPGTRFVLRCKAPL